VLKGKSAYVRTCQERWNFRGIALEESSKNERHALGFVGLCRYKEST